MKTSFFKFFVISLLFTLGSVQYSKAQAMWLVLIFGDKAATENFFFSIEGGLNFAYMPGMAGRMNLQPNFGLGVNMKINDKWYFVPQFKPFSRKGQKRINAENPFPTGFNNSIDSYKTSIRMNYLDIPLMFRYDYTDEWFFSIGPQISFLLDAKYITVGDGSDDGDFLYAKSTKNNLNNVDFSFPIEIGYTFTELNNGHGIDLKLRYAHGFSEVFKEETGMSATNSVVQLIIGFPYLKSDKQSAE